MDQCKNIFAQRNSRVEYAPREEVKKPEGRAFSARPAFPTTSKPSRTLGAGNRACVASPALRGMVEAAGIAPASEDLQPRVTTCVAPFRIRRRRCPGRARRSLA